MFVMQVNGVLLYRARDYMDFQRNARGILEIVAYPLIFT